MFFSKRNLASFLAVLVAYTLTAQSAFSMGKIPTQFTSNSGLQADVSSSIGDTNNSNLKKTMAKHFLRKTKKDAGYTLIELIGTVLVLGTVVLVWQWKTNEDFRDFFNGQVDQTELQATLQAQNSFE